MNVVINPYPGYDLKVEIGTPAVTNDWDNSLKPIIVDDWSQVPENPKQLYIYRNHTFDLTVTPENEYPSGGNSGHISHSEMVCLYVELNGRNNYFEEAHLIFNWYYPEDNRIFYSYDAHILPGYFPDGYWSYSFVGHFGNEIYKKGELHCSIVGDAPVYGDAQFDIIETNPSDPQPGNGIDIPTTGIPGVDNVLQALAKSINDALSSISNGVGDALKNVIDGLGNNLHNIVSGITNGITTALNTVLANLNDILQGIGDSISNAFDGIKTVFNNITTELTANFDDIVTKISHIGDSITTIAENIYVAVGDTFNNVGTLLGTTLHDALYNVLQGLNALHDNGQEYVDKIIQNGKDTIAFIRDNFLPALLKSLDDIGLNIIRGIFSFEVDANSILDIFSAIKQMRNLIQQNMSLVN